LLAEIAAIGTAGPNSVIAIDDARLFLAPPTAAHVIGDWPHFEEVLARLQRAAPDHHILVLNDVIWTVPGAAFDTMLDYAARHGADWLAIAEKARTYDAVIVQLREKDREINALTAENQARLELVDRLNSTLAQISKERSVKEPTREFENQIAALQAVAEERAELITTLDATARSAGERAADADSRAQNAERECDARQVVIEELVRARDAFSAALAPRAQPLEAAAADLTGQIVAATGRADALEQIAVERSALIDRLDELARERAAALASWQARALAAEQQLVDVTAVAADAASRAQNAERECDARQVVIEELVRARDAFSAALATGPRPTRLGRLFFRNSP
jgi:chromosome segregation ATPase